MDAEYYFISEGPDVLFAHLVNPRFAASRLDRSGNIVLASPEDLQELADRRNRLLAHETEPIPA